MVYKYKDAEKRKVGNEIEIIDLYQGKNMPLNFVIEELNGFHGTMVNEKSIKYYYIIDGKAKVTINDEVTDFEKGDFVVTVDGFIVSSNVDVVYSNVIETDYKYSDHNPVMMRIKLKK